MIERSEFASWRNSDVYKEFQNYFREQMSFKAQEMINRKQPDGNRDMYVRGVIAAYAEMIEWEPEFPEIVVDGEADEV